MDTSKLSGSFAGAAQAGDARDAAGIPPIPPEVREQMGAAAQLAEDLHADGRSIRFDVHGLDGNVVATLRDQRTGVQRPMPLEDVLDPDRLRCRLDGERR